MTVEQVDVITKRVKTLQVLIFVMAIASAMTSVLIFPNLYYVKDALKAQSYQFTLFRTLTFLPWNLKPIVGYMEDTKSFCGYRLKLWILLGSTLYLVSCVAMYFITPRLNMFTFLALIYNIGNVL